MPRPKKPNSLKLLTGSRRIDKNTGVELPTVDTLPSAPDWLPNSHAVDEFNRLARILHANKLLTEVGLSPLAVLAAIFGSIVQSYKDDRLPTGAIVAQYRAACGDFGLTPTTVGKVTPTSEPKKENRFANNGRHPLKSND